MPRKRDEQFNTLLPKALRIRIKVLSIIENRKMHEIIREALEGYVAGREKHANSTR